MCKSIMGLSLTVQILQDFLEPLKAVFVTTLVIPVLSTLYIVKPLQSTFTLMRLAVELEDWKLHSLP